MKNITIKKTTTLPLNILVLEQKSWVCTPWILWSLNYYTQNYVVALCYYSVSQLLVPHIFWFQSFYALGTLV